jgi:hypothetical protein
MGYDKFGLDWNVWGTGNSSNSSSSTNPLLDGVGKGWGDTPGNKAVEETEDSSAAKDNGTTARLKNAKFLPDSSTAFNKPCKIRVEIESKTPVTAQVVIALWGKYKEQEHNLQHEIKVSPNGSTAEGSLNLYYVDDYYNDFSADPSCKETVDYIAKCSMKGASPIESEPLVMPLSKNIVMVFQDDKEKSFKKVKITLKNGDVITSDDSGTITIPAPEDDSAVEIVEIEIEESATPAASQTPPAQTVSEPAPVSNATATSPVIPETKSMIPETKSMIEPLSSKTPDTSQKPHYRPGYTGHQVAPSAPDVLDFVETDIILKDLSENEFRQKIVETLKAMDDIGLNRSKGASRAEAYLDMVTWDDSYRKSWKNDNSVNSSSCGMFVRNTWWLCGARGAQLFDENYKGGVIAKILDFEPKARKRWGSGFNAKTFFPKIGDVIYLYKADTNSQHIFTIYEIDKKIEMVNGESIIYNGDGTLASEITFTGVDGGQLDGVGPDSTGTSKSWGCQAIRKTERKMKLNSGHFMNIGSAWTKPDGSTGRPINTWVDTWAAKDKFTAKYVQSIRKGAAASVSAEPPAPAQASTPPPAPTPAATQTNTSNDDFYSWPSKSGTLPDSIINKIIENRNALPDYGSALHSKSGGFSYNGKKFEPDQILSKPEEQSNAKLKAVIERLHVEMGGEGGVSAVMTGDSAKFTWGRGLAHGGGLEGPMKYFIEHCPAAKTAFLDHGIILEGTKDWKIVDTDNKCIKAGESAIDYLNGSSPEKLKKTLLSAFIKISEDNGQSAATAQWVSFKEQYFYQDKPSEDIINSWSPEAICYVVHCKAWGSFAGWSRFKNTGGDLKKILRMEVEFTKFNENKGSYLYVPSKLSTKEIYPAITMLLNMGHRHMIDSNTVEPVDSADAAENGDIIFQMDKKSSGAKSEYYILRNVPSQYDPKEEMNIYIANVQGYSMDTLLKEFAKMRGTTNTGYNKLKAHRDWYADPSNPKKEKWGLRPMVAMDAILHKNEGDTAAWILDVCKSVDISETNCWDQYDLIKKTIGIA